MLPVTSRVALPLASLLLPPALLPRLLPTWLATAPTASRWSLLQFPRTLPMRLATSLSLPRPVSPRHLFRRARTLMSLLTPVVMAAALALPLTCLRFPLASRRRCQCPSTQRVVCLPLPPPRRASRPRPLVPNTKFSLRRIVVVAP